jgi:DNA-directed RNA polymerase subunit RPC12/RpoP
MSKRDHDPSVEREPHLSGAPAEPDPSERVVDASSRRACNRTGDDPYSAGQSVFDEPDILPGRAAELITQDWTCSQCGYNLRGLETGHRCPECGHVELYRPPPPGASSFSDWYRRKREAVSPAMSWAAVLAAAVLGGPWAVFGAFISGGIPNPLSVVLFGPAVEEVLKIAAVAVLVEARPYLIKRAEQITTAALLSAFLFAVIENILYLQWYVAAPSLALVLWRWLVCTALHMTCTWIAIGGLVAVWQRTDAELRKPRLGQTIRPVTHAIILHGVYNASVLIWGFIDASF